MGYQVLREPEREKLSKLQEPSNGEVSHTVGRLQWFPTSYSSKLLDDFLKHVILYIILQ